jgi:group II intron reverse transcriptase/maturase
MNMLRERIHDKRVIDLIKKYLKSGVMENGVVTKTEEGSPQGGNLSPLLANVYLDRFDHEFEGRGVRVIRYADDIVLLARSQRAAERLLGTSRTYLEKKLKLKVNEEKSKVVSVYSIRNFKFLGFALGRNMNGTYIRVHAKPMKKAKEKLKALTSRSQGRNVRAVMHKVKVYMQGWLGYYSIADMKTTIDDWNGWLRRRIRMYIWKQWKKPKTRVKNLLKLGIPEWAAHNYGNSRKGYWRMSGTTTLNNALSNKRLAQAGYFDISQKYKSLHLSG